VERTNDLSLMVLGLSGAGKSTLVNKILGEMKAEESSATTSCTNTCTAYKYEGEVGTRKTTITVIDTPGSNDTEGRTVTMLNDMASFVRPHNFNAVLLVIKEEKITPVTSTIIEVYGALTASIPDDNIGIVVTHMDIPGVKEHPYHPRVKKQKQEKMQALQEIQKEVSKRSGKFIVKILPSELFLPDEEVRNWLLTCFASVPRFVGSSLRSVENLVLEFQTTIDSYEKNDKSKMLQVVKKEKETLEGRKSKLIVSAGVLGGATVSTFIGGFIFPPAWIAAYYSAFGTTVIAATCAEMDEEIKALESQIDSLKKAENLRNSPDMVQKYQKAKNSLQTINKMTQSVK